MLNFHALQMPLQVCNQGIWQDGETVILAFSIAHDELMVAKIQILDAESKTFHQAKPTSIEEFCHQLGRPFHFLDHGQGFGMRQNRRQGFGLFGSNQIGGNVNGFEEDMPVEKEDRTQGLVLRRGGNILLGC